MDPSDPVLVEVVRSGWVESVHRGRLVVLDGDGRATTDLGAVADAILLRSCAKPVQAVAALRAGWDPPSEQLALACASHDGTDAHLAVVRSILAAAGLDEADLAVPLGHPCSGKHAAMVAACRAQGWPVDTYLDPAHPLQQAVGATIEDLSGSEASHVAVDGCGAPIGAVPLTGLAQAFATIATAPADTPEGRVAAAMRQHPDLVAGARRSATRLMRGVPGLIAKDGAEGVYVAALADGRAVAVKVDDGAARAAEVVVASAVAHLVGEETPGVDLDLLADVALPDVTGGGEPVGEVRSIV